MDTENSRRRRRHSAEQKAQILAECAVPGASVAKVAMAHGINTNIVHGWRKLAREGSSFQKIKDALRRDLAIQRLVKTQESIGHVAASLGFDNLPSFHRAFLAWTGSTPGAYRKQMAQQA